MRFRFNGDADCPDWILNEIYSLSKLSSVKLKVLTQMICQSIITPPFQIAKVEKLFADSKFDSDIDLKTCIACLNYILCASIQYNCDSVSLQSELQQLGLPREHSVAIKKVYDDNREALILIFKTKSLRISGKISQGLGEIILEIEGANPKLVAVAPDTVNALLAELHNVRQQMIDLNK